MTRFYSTANWQAIRRKQLAKHPLCQGCVGIVPATVADHIRRITEGGAKRDPANLQSLCRACHQDKTAAERAGKTWTPPAHRGCFADGSPRDPAHPWYTGGDQPQGAAASRPTALTQTELVVGNGSKRWE